MPADRSSSRRLLLAAALAASALLAGCASPPQDAAPVLARAAQALGTDRVTTLRYAGEGSGATFGQAFEPGGAWPRITLHSVTRSIDYAAGAMREEIVLSRAEPRGGGGYPLAGQQRNDQYVSGELAWNVANNAPAAGPRFVADRLHQLWITPHGVIKAAQRAGSGAQARAGEAAGGSAVSFALPGRLSAVAQIDAAGRVTRVDSVYPDPVMGDTAATTTYDDYRDFGNGVQFPARVRQTVGGHPVLDLAVKEVQLNPALALAVPDAVRSATERVTTEQVAPGVWFVGGGSHNSVAIEQRDHLILVEAPLNDGRTQAVLASVKALAPGKPVAMVVNSHAHFDHAGGVRAAVAEGATIVTQAANVPYFERVLAQPSRIRPDALAQSGARPKLRAVGERLDIGDAARPVEVHRIAGGHHSDSFVLVYLPRERLLIEADAFTPGPPGAPAPATPNTNNVNLVENIERLKLNVERILPLHGRVVPLAELYTAVGRAAPAR